MARQQSRVQAPDIQGPDPLRPAPLPGDTFTGAPRPVIDQNMARISDALGAFNQNLQQYGTVAAHLQAKQQHDLEQGYLNREILGRTPEQWLQATQKGELPAFQNPIIRGGMEKYSGGVLGDQIAQEYSAKVKSGEINPLDEKTDVAGVITQMTQDKLHNFDGQGNPWKFANSPYALGGLKPKIDALRESAIKHQQDVQAQEFAKEQYGVAYREINSVFDQPALSQDGVQEAVRNKYTTLGSVNPKSSLAIPPQVLDKAMIDVARERAGQGSTAANAIYALTAERKDQQGNPLPPLDANPKYAKEVAAIRTTATNTLSNKYVEDTKQLAAQGALSALQREDGSFWKLTDATRSNEFKKVGDANFQFPVKAEDARKQAVDMFLQQSAQQGGPPVEQFEREYKTLANNNVVHPAWERDPHERRQGAH
jgi:hypothetical protein